MSSPRPLELQRLSGKSSQLLMGQLLSYSSHMCGDAHYRVYVIMYTYVVCNVTVLCTYVISYACENYEV